VCVLLRVQLHFYPLSVNAEGSCRGCEGCEEQGQEEQGQASRKTRTMAMSRAVPTHPTSYTEICASGPSKAARCQVKSSVNQLCKKAPRQTTAHKQVLWGLGQNPKSARVQAQGARPGLVSA
jgi:hypothetical protein